MNRPMIENNDRGITVNKSLGWTMAVGVLIGGIWIGTETSRTKEAIQNISERQIEDRIDIRTNAANIGVLSSSNARIDQHLSSLDATTKRTEELVQRMYRDMTNRNIQERENGSR